jgi:hypothetical protein
MEDTPVKALCAVVFVLSSLGAPAQALEASTAYCADDFFWWTIEQSMIPAQIVAPTIEKLGEAVDEAHDVTITGPKDAANVPVRAIQPSDETRTVETGKGNKLTVHDIIEQSTIPAQIVATEPTIEKLGEAVDEAHDVTITGPKDAANVPVGAIQPNDETRTVEYATGKGDKLTVDDTIEQSTMAAPILTTEPAIEKLGGATPQVDGITMTAPNDAQDVPVGAIQPSNKTPNVASSIQHDDKLRLDAPIEQSTMSAQTIAPAPAIERLDLAHGVAITAPNNAGDLPVRGDSPQQQNSERGVLNLE